MKLPEQVDVELTSGDENISGLIVEMKVTAGNKNPYYIYFPKTDKNGKSLLKQEDIIGQFNDYNEVSMMDYNGTTEAANPEVEITLFDYSGMLKNKDVILGFPLSSYEKTRWKSRQEKYDYMISCENGKFKLPPTMINLEKTSDIKLEIEKR